MKRRSIEAIHIEVANATVKLPQMGGQGVLVSNWCVVTAAHCLKYNQNTGMRIRMDGHILYKIETASREKMQLAPLVIDPISDVAVLGALDDQIFPRDMREPFESFCRKKNQCH